MARTTYTNIPDSDVDADSPVTTELMTAIRDNLEAVRVQIVQVNVSEASTSSGSYATLATIWVYVPDVIDYTGISRQLVANFEVKTTAGTATYRIYDNTGSTASTEDTTTNTSYEAATVTLTFGASVKGTVREIQLQAKTTSGTCYAQATHRADWWMDF